MRFRGICLRRAVVRAAAGILGASIMVALPAGAFAEDRTLSMYEIHTKETINITYKRDGVWDEEALEKINWFMRDWRADEPTKMNRELIDLVWTLHNRLGSKEPIHLISAYRSQKTNDKLRRAGGGQARRSQHTLGRACDIHFPDIPVKKLRASALIQEIGGVGYYPRSGIPFVHVDVGNVRMWPRMPRLELAALFPEGKTAYVPSDGRRITKADHNRALAKGMVDPVLLAQARGVPQTMVAGTLLPTKNPVRVMAQLNKPAAPAQMVASAGRPTLKPMALAPADAELPETEKPDKSFALASLGGGLPWARETLRPANAPQSKLPEARPAPTTNASLPLKTPSYENAAVIEAPRADDEHLDELSYQPVETASLMSDTSVAHDRTIAPLTHPEQNDLDYLLKDMDKPAHFVFRTRSGYLGLASVRTLSGPAVRNLYAALAKKSPTRLAQAN